MIDFNFTPPSWEDTGMRDPIKGTDLVRHAVAAHCPHCGERAEIEREPIWSGQAEPDVAQSKLVSTWTYYCDDCKWYWESRPYDEEGNYV